MNPVAKVQIVQMTPLFRKSPFRFSRKPNNRKKALHLHYLHSQAPVFAMFEGVQP